MTTTKQTSPSTRRHTVLIVDDHPIVRQGLTQLIAQEPDIEVCGGADSLQDALEHVARLQPDLILVDISLKDGNGLDLIHQLKSAGQSIKTLVWSMFDETVYAERALRVGAMGYVNKQESIETVISAVRQVLRGNVYLSPRLASILVRRVGGGAPICQPPVAVLSNRELDVFAMIGRGMTTHEIARRLKLSPKTIETHRERIKIKMNLRNAAELNRCAVLWVLENG